MSSTNKNLPGWFGVWNTLLAVVLLTGIASGWERDPIGEWVLAVIATAGVISGVGWLWTSVSHPVARVVWVVICLLPITTLATCRLIALSGT